MSFFEPEHAAQLLYASTASNGPKAVLNNVMKTRTNLRLPSIVLQWRLDDMPLAHRCLPELFACCIFDSGLTVILLENLRFHIEEEGKRTEKGDDGEKKEIKAGDDEVKAFRASLSKLGRAPQFRE
eukprot:s1864_g3.t6